VTFVLNLAALKTHLKTPRSKVNCQLQLTFFILATLYISYKDTGSTRPDLSF
jgi:hypothetical protein